MKENGNKNNYINNLPNDLLMMVFSKLPVETLVTLAFVCKKYREASGNNDLWRSHLLDSGIEVARKRGLINNAYKTLFFYHYDPDNYDNFYKETYYIALPNALQKPTLKMKLQMHSQQILFRSKENAQRKIRGEKAASGYNIIYEVKLSKDEFNQLEPHHVHAGSLINHYMVNAADNKCPIITVTNIYYKLSTDNDKSYISVKTLQKQENTTAKRQDTSTSGCLIN